MSREINTPPSTIHPRGSRVPSPRSLADTSSTPGVEALRPRSAHEASLAFRRRSPAQTQMDFGPDFLNPRPVSSMSSRTVPIALPDQNRRDDPTVDAGPPAAGCEDSESWISESLEPWVGGMMVLLAGLAAAALMPV